MRAKRSLLLLLASAALSCSKHDAATSVGRPGAALLQSAGSPLSPEPPSAFAGKVAALAWELRVHERPSAGSRALGYLRAGAVVGASDAPVAGDGCRGEWRAVSPAGFVCVAPGEATLNLEDPLVRALSRRPDLEARLPYMYGIARRPAPVYARLPTHAEALEHEPYLEEHMRAWLSEAGEDGAAFRYGDWLRGNAEPQPAPLELWQTHATRDVPDWAVGGKMPLADWSAPRQGTATSIGISKNHNGFALLDTAVVEGRRYGITTDLLVFPVDRMRPIEGSAFHGARIPEDMDYPFAFVRREGAEAYSMSRGRLTKVRDVDRHTAIRLSGRQRLVQGVLHFETVDGLWLSERFVSRVGRAPHLPRGANEADRWVDVSIAKQLLVAYEGMRPVYATLVSTGEAGMGDPTTTKSTVIGAFRIFSKHVTTTMDSDVVGSEFELKDVPYVQYFSEGYALHTAYWHDDFGIPRSHGCINLAPEDALWLFRWTQPAVPEQWHGARAASGGSVVNIHP